MHEIVFYVQCNMMILKLLSVGKLTFSVMLVVEHISLQHVCSSCYNILQNGNATSLPKLDSSRQKTVLF